MKLLLLFAILAIPGIVYTKRGRIIDGTLADLHEFPYQVSLQWNFNNGSRPRHVCGGSILNRRWILSAAHCKAELSRDGWIEVVAGVNNIVDEENTAQRSNISRFIQHESYNPMTVKNDIAVILLSRPLHLNRVITTITLAPQDAVINQTVADLAGWGSISKTTIDIFPDELRKVVLPLRTLEDCRQLRPVDSSQVCAGGYRNVSACITDSGGPLTVVTYNGDLIQIGVVSYGERPCQARTPIVFSSVMHFRNWIQRSIQDEQLN